MLRPALAAALLLSSPAFAAAECGALAALQQDPQAAYAKLAKDSLDYSWTMSWAFAVDDDQDDPGDWVHAGFDEVGTLNGDTVETAFIEEWYFVLDGQVHYYSNSKRLLP